jgi:hypothetical protein
MGEDGQVRGGGGGGGGGCCQWWPGRRGPGRGLAARAAAGDAGCSRHRRAAAGANCSELPGSSSSLVALGRRRGADPPTPPAAATAAQIRTRTNRSGGIQGGISNGEDIVMRIAFKPTSTIGIKQRTVTRDGEEVRARRLLLGRCRAAAAGLLRDWAMVPPRASSLRALGPACAQRARPPSPRACCRPPPPPPHPTRRWTCARAGATTRASCRAPCPWWSRWWPWCWRTSCCRWGAPGLLLGPAGLAPTVLLAVLALAGLLAVPLALQRLLGHRAALVLPLCCRKGRRLAAVQPAQAGRRAAPQPGRAQRPLHAPAPHWPPNRAAPSPAPRTAALRPVRDPAARQHRGHARGQPVHHGAQIGGGCCSSSRRRCRRCGRRKEVWRKEALL